VSDADVVRRNLDKQREYYGELFGERVRRLVVGYDISQAQLAEVLGVSAPMLSQVMSGRRQKMANPAVWARLVMLERSLQTAQGDPQLRDRLVEVREATAAAAVLGAAAPGPDSIVAGLRECYPPGGAQRVRVPGGRRLARARPAVGAGCASDALIVWT